MGRANLGESKQKILRLLLDGETTAQELASRMGMNLSVVRRHLDDMVGLKLVGSSFKRMGRGRPIKLYSISAEGRTEVSAMYDLVADLLTIAARKDLGNEKSVALYRSAGEVLAGSVGKSEDPGSLMPVLTDFGFQPELRKSAEKQLIISKNCPILKLAKAYPELTCDVFHTVFLHKSLSGGGIVLKQAIARGAKECIHEYSIA